MPVAITKKLSPRVKRYGPFYVTINYGLPAPELFRTYIAASGCVAHDTEIASGYFPYNVDEYFKGIVTLPMYYFNFGCNMSTAEANAYNPPAQRLFPATSEMVLGFGCQVWQGPPLIDKIFIGTGTLWKGREKKANGDFCDHALCLHNDKIGRRIRIHFAETDWGPHINFLYFERPRRLIL